MKVRNLCSNVSTKGLFKCKEPEQMPRLSLNILDLN